MQGVRKQGNRLDGNGGICMLIKSNSNLCSDNMKVDPVKIMFLDGVCTKCGHSAGNGGICGAPLRCGACGWVQPEAEAESMYKEMNAIMEGFKE